MSELIERDIRSKNGLAPEVRGLFVSIIDRIWLKMGFEVMPQRRLGDICAVSARTIGRDRDEHLAETESSYESLMDRIETLCDRRSQVSTTMGLLHRYSTELGDADYREGNRVLQKLKRVINNKLEKRRQQKTDLADRIYNEIADGTDNIFGFLNQHCESEEVANATDVASLPDPDQSVTSVTSSVVDEEWADDLVDGDLLSDGEAEDEPAENEDGPSESVTSVTNSSVDEDTDEWRAGGLAQSADLAG